MIDKEKTEQVQTALEQAKSLKEKCLNELQEEIETLQAKALELETARQQTEGAIVMAIEGLENCAKSPYQHFLTGESPHYQRLQRKNIRQLKAEKAQRKLDLDNLSANTARYEAAKNGKLISSNSGTNAVFWLAGIIGFLLATIVAMVGHYKFHIQDQLAIALLSAFAVVFGLFSGFFIVGNFVVCDPTLEPPGPFTGVRTVTLEAEKTID